MDSPKGDYTAAQGWYLTTFNIHHIYIYMAIGSLGVDIVNIFDIFQNVKINTLECP